MGFETNMSQPVILSSPRMDGAGNQAAPKMARSMSLSLKEVKARCILGGSFLWVLRGVGW